MKDRWQKIDLLGRTSAVKAVHVILADAAVDKRVGCTLINICRTSDSGEAGGARTSVTIEEVSAGSTILARR